jgi:hypothetical protein
MWKEFCGKDGGKNLTADAAKCRSVVRDEDEKDESD